YSAGKSKTDTMFSDASAGAALFAASSSDSLNGVIAGFQGGYNWMASSLLRRWHRGRRSAFDAEHDADLISAPAQSAIRPLATRPRRASTARRNWIGSALCAAASARRSRPTP